MTPGDGDNSEWTRKGATLTEGTARKEFGLTREELAQAFKAGKLQARRTWIHGNPSIRLLRREVEALVSSRHGDGYLKDQQATTELAQLNRELKRLKKQIAVLERRREALIAGSNRGSRGVRHR
jgi:hypothetical protein